MHFITLMAVRGVPQTFGIKNPEGVKALQEALEKLKTMKNFDATVYKNCVVNELKKRVTVFGSEVCKRCENQIWPYSTENLTLNEWVTEIEEEDFHNIYLEMLEDENGVRHRPYEVNRRIEQGKILYLVVQNNINIVDYKEDTSGEYKIVKVHADEIYESLRDYVENGATYYEYNEEEHAAGYWSGNPYSIYDYYQIGGRRQMAFLVRNTCNECIVEEDDRRGVPLAPEGYKWAVAARHRDIAYDEMRKWRLKNLQESGETESENDFYSHFCHSLFTGNAESFECYVSRDDIPDIGGVVKKFINDLNPNDVLVSIDCHI